jgi:hypothetical protein
MAASADAAIRTASEIVRYLPSGVSRGCFLAATSMCSPAGVGRPGVITFRVECGCGHAEDATYEFDMPAADSGLGFVRWRDQKLIATQD